MIVIDYSEGIKITTGNLNGIFKPEQLPLKFEIKKVVSKEIAWTTELNSNMWATYPINEINDVVVNDNQNNLITRYYWDVIKHGSIFYKSLWFYCKSLVNSGKQPYGVVIGTHDGEFGEWVPLVKNYLSDMLLIEGSTEQFVKLSEYYGNKSGITLMNEIITPQGGKAVFFEGGRGYTNSVVERVIRSWEKEEIKSTWRNSKDINTILTYENRFVDWLHLDVEGLDAKLLKSINLPLPPFIIFEDYNLIPDEKTDIYQYLSSLGYNLHSESGICMATK